MSAQNTLLATKLFPPGLRSRIVSRPHLIKRMADGVQRPLTLVSAPAGFGKTTLVSEWTRGEDVNIPIAWVSLDEDDNDPARFLAYLLAALERIAPEVTANAQSLLLSSQATATKPVLTALINDLNNLPQPVVLILDDYHFITATPVHEGMTFLLERLPPELHLILLTRSDPPFPLARLRARGIMVELRAADLGFTTEEAATFLNSVMGLNLSQDDIEALEARTEGWIAGLQLAALSMRGREDLSGFVSEFTGSNRFVLDYLVEEVISRQPSGVQRFLLQTSILERMCSSLCDELVAGEDSSFSTLEYPDRVWGSPPRSSQDILAYLDRSNLFLIPLDDERQWFRYHHLFGDLLRARLQQTEATSVPALHLRASIWHERNDFIVDAIRHAFAAQNYERAAFLIEKYGHKRWALSDTEFLKMVGRLPDKLLETHPTLGIYQAWTHFLYGQFQDSERLLRAMQAHLADSVPSAEVRGLQSFNNILLIYIAEMTGRKEAARLPDRHVLDLVPEHHLGMRNSVDVVYAYLLFLRGELDGAIDILLNTVRRDIAAAGTTAIPIAISRVARIRTMQGRLREAAELCREYLCHIEERGKDRFYISGNLHIVLGDIQREWNELEAGERQIRAGLHANESWKMPQATAVGYLALARLQLAQGDVEGSTATLDRLEQSILGRTLPTDLMSELHALRVRLSITKGDIATARDWVIRARPSDGTEFRRELDHITLARLMLAENEYPPALDLLALLVTSAESGQRYGRLLEILVLQAHALAALNRIPAAIQKIDICLGLAEPQGYRRIFLDEGPVIRDLLAAYLREPSSSHLAYAKLLLEAFSVTDPSIQISMERLIEPLTKRELQVLGLICAGESNRSIAQQLVVTISTVKKHTGNIYGKLGVTSRTQAIARAHELGLWPPAGPTRLPPS